jgi:hypothetical protein
VRVLAAIVATLVLDDPHGEISSVGTRGPRRLKANVMFLPSLAFSV